LPIALACSLYTGVVYGYLYLMFATFTFVFQEQYAFPTSSVGLTFLGVSVGSLIGLLVVGIVSDRLLKAKVAKAGALKPEFRLPPLLPAAILTPAGLFLYGWAAQSHTH
jgi:hypothetical protein